MTPARDLSDVRSRPGPGTRTVRGPGCPDDAELAGFVEGALAEARREEILSHVEGCEACLAAVALSAAAAVDRGPVLRPGDVVGRYDLVEQLGRGAMGVVFRARDRELGRDVALKVVSPELRGDDALHERLRGEARALALVSSPYVVSVYDVGRVPSREESFVSMELVEGRTLRAFLAAERRSEAVILRCFHDAARGLAAAHEKGVVHRDFKPDNVLVGDDGRVRVSDFGLARSEGIPTVDADGAVGITATRNAGTPAYMAPEQLAGAPATVASDQFAFFVSLVEALSGARPTTTEARAAARKLREPIASLAAKGLSPKPSDRHGSMAEVAARLGELVAPKTRLAPWIAALAALVAGGVVAVRMTSPPSCNAGPAEAAVAWSTGDRPGVARALEALGDRGRARDVVAAALDAWTVAWARERDLACKASSGKPTPRDACLVGQRDRVKAFVTTLAEGRATSLAAVVAAAQDLPAPSRCGAAAEVEESPTAARLRARLSAATVSAWTGRSAAAAVELAALRDEASREKLPRLALRAGLELGLAEMLASHHANAKAALTATVVGAREIGDAELALDATIAWIEVLARDGDRATSDALTELARGELARLGKEPAREAALLRASCLAAERNKFELGSRLAACIEARDKTRAAHGPDDFRLAQAEETLGNVYWRLGRIREGEPHYRAALELYERVLGEGTPAAGRSRENVASVLLETGRPAEAEVLIRQRLEKEPESAMTHDTLAVARRLQGDVEGELRERAECLRLCLKQGNRYGQFLQLTYMGSAYAELGRFAEARASLDGAEELGVVGGRKDRIEVLVAEARIAQGEGDPKRACRLAARAKALLADFADDTDTVLQRPRLRDVEARARCG